MTGPPDVSVIMSVYNDERWIESCLNSVLAQTHQNFEFLIVDDASTDGTLAALQRFQDPRLSISRHEARSGWMNSINELAQASRGRILKLLCADDPLGPRCLESGIAFYEANPETTYAFTGFETIDEHGRSTGVVEILDRTCTLSGLTADEMNLRRGCLSCTSAMFVDRERWLKAGGLRDVTRHNPDRWPTVEDFDLMARLHHVGPAGYINEPLSLIRQHSSQVQRHSIGGVLSVEGYLYVLSAMADHLVSEGVLDRNTAHEIILETVAGTHIPKAISFLRSGQILGMLRILQRISWYYSLPTVVAFWMRRYGLPSLQRRLSLRSAS